MLLHLVMTSYGSELEDSAAQASRQLISRAQGPTQPRTPFTALAFKLLTLAWEEEPIILSLSLPVGIKIAQKSYIVWSLGPKALLYESLDSWGFACLQHPEA